MNADAPCPAGRAGVGFTATAGAITGSARTGRNDEDRKPVDIEVVLKRSLAVALRGTDVESVVDFRGSLLPVAGDEVKLQGVFIQLLLNMRRPAVEGGTLRVVGRDSFENGTRNGSEDAAFVHISLCDTRSGAGEGSGSGRGIHRPAGGVNNGLRFAVARSIVTDAGGWIEESYDTRSGMTIDVYLPAGKVR